MRNRRRIQRLGPLIIYNRDSGLTRAFRNIPGVDTICVDKLNLLKLAPGGHVGRFCIWTESGKFSLAVAFSKRIWVTSKIVGCSYMLQMTCIVGGAKILLVFAILFFLCGKHNVRNLQDVLKSVFSAFRKLDSLYGTWTKDSKKKKGYRLPMPKMTNTDLARILKSDEIQCVVRAPRYV